MPHEITSKCSLKCPNFLLLETGLDSFCTSKEVQVWAGMECRFTATKGLKTMIDEVSPFMTAESFKRRWGL